jgi:hypothetical protein
VEQSELRAKLHADLEAYLTLLQAQEVDGELILRLRLRDGKLHPGWTVQPPRPKPRGWRRHRNCLTSGTG